MKHTTVRVLDPLELRAHLRDHSHNPDAACRICGHEKPVRTYVPRLNMTEAMRSAQEERMHEAQRILTRLLTADPPKEH